ncbi:MAG: RICIN domain-containing protein [Bacteroidaceae bacterium]|nr:RICIN domain-containing protein [Bacteroidaceae bacterium]
MKKKLLSTTIALCFSLLGMMAQSVTTASSSMTASPWAVSVPFDITQEGEKKEFTFGMGGWSWDFFAYQQRNHCGKENMGIARVGFTGRYDASYSELTDAQKTTMDNELNNIVQTGVKSIFLLCGIGNEGNQQGNASGVPSWNDTRRNNYVNDIVRAVEYIEGKGYEVFAVAPFNEPDFEKTYTGDASNFNAVAQIMQTKPKLAGKVFGPSTLNSSEAPSWYNTVKENINYANTHQLAGGNFTDYTGFWQQAYNDGKKPVADEMHNVMEPMVCINYGGVAGTWWGWEGITRGEYVRMINNGRQLVYKERPNEWMTTSVNKYPGSNFAEAFIGTSERQAVASAFTYLSKGRLAYYDGHGPAYDYTEEVPGGAKGSYQNGQTNAERLINIYTGEDVPVEPVNGKYKIVNKASGKIVSLEGGNLVRGNVYQWADGGLGNQIWDVYPIDKTTVADYSYVVIRNANTSSIPLYLDAQAWNMDNNANVSVWSDGDALTTPANIWQRWHLRYVGDGYYNIINHATGLYLNLDYGSSDNGANINEFEGNGTDAQLWKFVPADHVVDVAAPATPTGLAATVQSGAIKLTWTANNDSDIYGYMVYRYNDTAGIWECIGRKVQETAFLDNTCRKGQTLRYRIKALDKAYNLSSASAEVTAQPFSTNALVGQWKAASLDDDTENKLHVVTNGASIVVDQGHNAFSFDGTDDYIKMPYHVGDMQSMTFAAWVKGGSTAAWQRIFDFGNGEDEYLFLTPTNGSKMRFEIKKDGSTQGLDATTTLGTGTWKHVAVTIGANEVAIYINGVKDASTTSITLRPSDVAPTMSYLGRSQFDADPAFKGMMSDVRIYNYALTADEVKEVYGEDEPSIEFDPTVGRNYTFNAVALNVDGLPNQEISAIVTTVNLNPDGKNEAGATALCGILANSGWDIVGFSEDFNYHSYLAAAPASTYYNFGKHSGSITTNLTQAFTRAEIDGLGIAVAKRMSFTGDTSTGLQVQWGTEYGGSGLTTIGDNGADNMITKGFRMYTVTIADGVAVDVYILHMDANTADSDDDYDSNGKDKNIVAREAQLKQLADYIKANHNNRPVIILGDTNCRYTREQLKTGFIDYINDDARFTIKDAWVEHMWGGTYPTYGTESMMTDAYGMQKGEVVDKIFYINTTESNLKLTSNSYLHDESVTVSDHKPVVVNFTLTDPNGTAVENNSWQVNGGVIIENENMLDGCQVTDGTTYFIKNVSTGLYLKSGAKWGTQACEGSAGMPITVTLSNGKYRLGTLSGSMSAVYDPYMDNGNNTTWTLEEVAGTKYQYYLKIDDGRALSSTGETGNILLCKNFNAEDDKQKWVLLTEERMKEEMANATASEPFDVTPLLKAASFDRMDIDFSTNASSNWSGMSFTSTNGGDAATHNGYAYYNNTAALTVSQTLKSMPAGTYTVSFEGFYRATTRLISTSDKTMTVPVSFGNSSTNLTQNKSLGIGGDAQGTFRDGDTYLNTIDVTTTSQGDMTLKVEKPRHNSGTGTKNSWIALDNFVIKYKGTGSAVDNILSVKTKVANHINITAQKVAQLNAAGQAAYDISTVIYRYNNDLISSDGQAEIDMIDEAYEIALLGHKRGLVAEAIKGNGDVSALIINPSFETGDLTGWTTAGGGSDVNVYPNSNGTYTTSGCDEDYLFNSYGGDNGHTAHVKQTIKGIPNGLYELKVKVTSFDDRYVYITGNSYHTKVATTNGKTQFHEATLYFLVEDGSATIGAVGGNKGGGSEFIHYWPEQGCFFKADDFRLKYICDVPHGRLKLALDEANNARLDAYGQATLDISSYQTKYNNKSLTGDGTAEVTAIYNALLNAAKAQRTAGADMTWTIENPSFETGNYKGWMCNTASWDTGAKSQENGTYTVAGTDGRYMFNTWHPDGNVQAVTQTVTGIPNGKYKVTAMVATDANNSINLTANGQTTTIKASSNGAGSGVFPAVECEVTNGTLAISVVGVNNVWYKCDDFRLTLLMPNELILNEGDKIVPEINDVVYSKITVNRTIKPNTWSTFVVPFDIPASFLAGWEVKELSGSTFDKENGHISLTFADAEDGIKAGVPYMVRNTTMTENLTAISMENVEVNTTAMESVSTDDVEFIGTYTNGYVPQGAFFISSNTFYRAADNSNTMKAFRAYLMPLTEEGKAALSISYRTDGETTAIDNSQLTNDNEPTVVAIYNLQGVRLDDMQEGVNILQMSDGRVVKVIIK